MAQLCTLSPRVVSRPGFRSVECTDFPPATPTSSTILPPGSPPNRAIASSDGFEPRKQPSCVVIDGTNVIRLFRNGQPRLELLLCVLMEVAVPATDFICFFDAPTKYELENKQSRRHADVYTTLCERHPQHFIECTGGTQADLYIILEAAARNASIVSNDRYRDYAPEYPWVASERDRFLRMTPVRQVVYVGDRRVALIENLDTLSHNLLQALERRNTKM